MSPEDTVWVAIVFRATVLLEDCDFLIRFAIVFFFEGRFAVELEGIKRTFPGLRERGFLMRLKSLIARIVVLYWLAIP